MSTVEDTTKSESALKLTATNYDEQQYLILEEQDINLQDLLAQFGNAQKDKKMNDYFISLY